MIRRGLLPHDRGGGFWAAWRIGLGACTGDFIWALAVTTGAGALLNKPGVRLALSLVSFALLLFLAFTFSRAAWKAARSASTGQEIEEPSGGDFSRRQPFGRRTYLLGLAFALSSPWNIGFWLAVVGSQQTMASEHSFLHSLTLAAAVVLGAFAWTIVLSTAVRSGARIFARPSWQIWTQALTAAVMLYFAVKLALLLFL
jgi:threonine/homoserine/homoserine lactone efflux protein